MSTDFTALAVALVGVAGTMGAPWLTQRARHAEARDQAVRDERAREASSRDQLFEKKRALYATLNTATRGYRSALRDCALELGSPQPSEESFTALDQARAAYREQYSQAEMVLPARPFEVAVIANEHLGYGYKRMMRLVVSTNRLQDADQVLAFVRGPLVVAVELLRLALREDLGVVEPTDDLEAQLAALPIRGRSRQVGQPLEAPAELLTPLGLEQLDADRRADEGPTATGNATDEPEQAA